MKATCTRFHSVSLATLTLALLTLSTHSAQAMQPLSDFVQSARKNNFDAREAKATLDVREADAQANTRRLLPTLSARGVYTHNQFDAVIGQAQPDGTRRDVTIVPKNQLDAFITLDVPIIDFGNWARISSGNTSAKAAEARIDATQLDVEQAVIRSYNQVLAGRAVVASAKRTLDNAFANLKVIEMRKAAGLALELDYQRAVAESERAKQTVANAEFLAGQQERALATLSGLKPIVQDTDAPVADDLHAEPALETFLRKAGEESPSVKAARLEKESTEKLSDAASYALLPTLTGTAQQRFTNATGFQDRNAVYSLGATLSWRLDLSVLSQAKSVSAQKDLQEVRKERADRTNSDAVTDGWAMVNMQIASTKAARAEAEASRLAEKIAQERYNSGTALQVDVLQAARQAFQAEAVRIQAEADLATARAALRLLATKTRDSIGEKRETSRDEKRNAQHGFVKGASGGPR
jgi:outer membrane protein TolC